MNPSIWTRKSISLAVALFLTLGLGETWAVPACPEAIDLQQPDGTAIRLHVRGDEWVHWMEDQEGYAVLHDQGRYVYAQLDKASGRLTPTKLDVGRTNPKSAGLIQGQRPTGRVNHEARVAALSAAEQVAGATGVNETVTSPPHSLIAAAGSVKNLVILCQFSDHGGTMIRATNNFDKIFNTVGGDPTLAPSGSVKDYYKETSYGSVDLQSTVLAWVVLPTNEAYYADGANTGTGLYPKNAQKMCEDALNLVNPLVDFGQFDQDHDGYVDAIDFIHSGYGAEVGSVSGRIWSHKWQLFSTWSSGDTNASGVSVKVSAYHTEPALGGSSGTNITTIGVICHETGHFFGLPDLYDTDNSSSGIGSWSLMANSWGFDSTGKYPPHFDAWCKKQLGWVTPIVISNGTFSAPMVETNSVVYRINNNFPSGEYLLIENRQPYSFDSKMGTGGLAIWHIDDNQAGNTTEGWPVNLGTGVASAAWPTNHYKIALLQADGLYEMERKINSGQNTDLFRSNGVATISHTSIPSTDSYKGGNLASTGILITNITASGSNMSFQLGLPFVNLSVAGTTLTAESAYPANGVPDPDETVTIQFAIQNTGILNTSNLVATLLPTGGVTFPSAPQTYGVVTGGAASVSRPFTFAPTGACGGTFQAALQLQDGTTDYGTLINTFTLGVNTAPPSYSSGSIAVAIPDSGTTNIPIVIPAGGVVSNVNVEVRIDHTYDSDLVISLVHPDNTVVLLANKSGSSGDNFGSGNTDGTGVNTVFDDSAATAVSAGAAPFAGSYRPEAPLSGLNGKSLAGTWTLRVQDTAATDVGTVYYVRINFGHPTYLCSSGEAPTSNARLADLVPSAGALTPSFAFNILSYTDVVSYATSNLTVTPTAVSSNASIKVDGIAVVSGTPSGLISLNVGASVITNQVVAQDFITTNAYTLTVIRAAASTNAYLTNLVLSAGTLAPAFSSTNFNYTAAVSYAMTNLTVTPTAADATASISVNGSPVASGVPSGSISLNVGSTIITNVVIAQGLGLTNTYRLTVTRAAGSSNAFLTGLTPSAGTLNPAFTSNVFSYTDNVTFAIGSMTVTPTAADSNATITVNGIPVTSGASSGAININVGANFITNVVVSQIRTATNTYLLSVTRAASISRWWDGGSTNMVAVGDGGSGGGSGIWDTLTTNWDQGTGQVHVAWNNANTNLAVFSGAAGTVTNQGVSVGGLLFTSAYTITNNTVTFIAAGPLSNSANVTLASVMAGAGPITKDGSGTVTLSGNNTYSNGMVINAGQVTVTADANLGDATGGLTFAGSSTLSGAVSYNAGRTFTLSNGVLATVIGAATIAGPVTGPGGIVHADNTVLTLSNAGNDFTGPISVSGGTTASLNISSMGDTAGAGLIKLGSAATQGILKWGGSAEVLVYRAVALAGTTGGGVIDSSGSGALTINSDVLITGTGAKTLTLSGTNTGANVFAGAITNGTGSAITVTKSGAGTWGISGSMFHTGGLTQQSAGGGLLMLSGTNTYSGATAFTVVNPASGNIVFQGVQALSPNTSLTVAHPGGVGGYGIFKLLDDGSGTISGTTVSLGMTISNTSGSLGVFVGNNNTGNGGSSAGTTIGSTIVLGNLAMNQSAVGNTSQTLSITGANGYRLQINNVTLNTQSSMGSWSGIFSPTTAPLTIAGNVTQVVGNVSVNSAVLQLDGTATNNYVFGAIADAADALTTGRPLNVTKANTGTWTLTGANTYRGATTITGGRLFINGVLSASSNAVIVSNAAATLSGTGTIVRAVTLSSGTLALGASVAIPTGTLNIMSNVTLASGAKLAVTINDAQAPSCGKIAVSGALVISNAILNLTNSLAPAQPVYVIATYGSLAGKFAATNTLPAGYTLDYTYNSGFASNAIALLSTNAVDADHDGMPDLWEVAHGLNPNDPSDAMKDKDGDGFSNLSEYLAGTDATNAASALRIVAVAATNGTFRISFSSVSGKVYAVQHNTNLLTASGWLDFSTNQGQNDSGPVQVLDPAAATFSSLFYRVRLVP